ncbi:MAG: SagB/ThcOx family dehydrogenase [Candidatus Cloacimonetes bacterium]|nr:SagB/ThcOx family dehydrogenase [Candidatus Cloacimonadota bacterium]
MDTNSEIVYSYHDRTKHRYDRYALGPPFMDWSNQPNPFRFFRGSKLLRLPFTTINDFSYADVFSCQAIETQNSDVQTLGFIFELSMGLSGWKSIESSSWSLRMNPSSGNLHPCEIYLILNNLEEDDETKLYHYTPFWHGLESIGTIASSESKVVDNNSYMIMSSIFWREAWKYGERAFRYCQLDMGHSIAAVSISAKMMGYDLKRDYNYSQKVAHDLLKIDQSNRHDLEREDLELGAWLVPSKDDFVANKGYLSNLEVKDIHLDVNQLSRDHRKWSAIEQVADATLAIPKSSPKPDDISYSREKNPKDYNAIQLIRQRRSAASYDGVTSISLTEFKCMLSQTLYQKNVAPFDFFDGPPKVHFLIFVHRVIGLDSGLYIFVRNHSHLSELKNSLNPKFEWQQIEDASIPLYLLQKGDYKLQAESISCGQSIASDSAFSLGMLSRFDKEVSLNPSSYKDLYWECGALGQLLYLEAERFEVRATGIGCFFDDECHRLAGIKDKSFQSLYHFTIGGPVNDMRFTSLSAYHHLTNEAYLNV